VSLQGLLEAAAGVLLIALFAASAVKAAGVFPIAADRGSVAHAAVVAPVDHIQEGVQP
jgi:hypothetical protein